LVFFDLNLISASVADLTIGIPAEDQTASIYVADVTVTVSALIPPNETKIS
jgi:hypothetical protein